MDVLIEVLKDSNYALTLFDQTDIDALKERVNFREVRGAKKPYVPCLIHEKGILLKPEEIARQLSEVISDYGVWKAPKDI